MKNWQIPAGAAYVAAFIWGLVWFVGQLPPGPICFAFCPPDRATVARHIEECEVSQTFTFDDSNEYR